MKHKSTLLLLMTTGMLLAACGGGNASSPSGSKPAGSSPTTSTPGSKTPSSPAPTSSSQPGSSAQPGSSSQPGGSSAQPTSSAQPGDSSAQADSSDSTPTADTFSAILATGQVITLAKNEAFEPTDEISAEYGGTASVTKNTVIKFQKNGTDLTAAAENGANAKAVEGGYAIHNDKANAGIYLKALSNGNYRFWIEGFETIYTVQIGDGDPLELTKDANAPEGTKAQYSVTSGFTKGAVLTFKAEGESISPSAKNTGNNAKVDDGVMTVLTTVDEAKLYLKLLNDDSYDVWLEGYQEPAPDTFAVTFGEGQAIPLTKNEAFEPTDEIAAEYGGTASVTKNTVIKFQKNGTDLTAVAEDGANVKAVEGGGYAIHNDKANAGIYLKALKNGNYRFWIEGLEYVYTVVVGTDLTGVMTKTEETPQGYDAQYKFSGAVEAGDALAFKKDDEALPVTPTAGTNNAALDDGVLKIVKTNPEADIYLKQKGAAYEVWVSDPVVVPEYYLAGTFNGWLNESDKDYQATFKLTKAADKDGDGNDVYVYDKISIRKGGKFKVKDDTNWYPANDLEATESADYKVTFVPATSSVAFDKVGDYSLDFYVSGTLNNWAAAAEGYKLTKQEEKEEGHDVYLSASIPMEKDVELKVTDGMKDGWYPNTNVKVTESADYQVKFIFDTGAVSLVRTGDYSGEIVATDYYLAGTVNDWLPDTMTDQERARYKLALHEDKKDGKDQYSITLYFTANSEFKIKSSKGGWWPNANFTLTDAGRYTIYFVPEGGIRDEGWHDGSVYAAYIDNPLAQ